MITKERERITINNYLSPPEMCADEQKRGKRKEREKKRREKGKINNGEK